MPGSPPTSTADPRTKPPPVTRSSSLTLVEMRGASSISPDSWRAHRPALAGGRAGTATDAAGRIVLDNGVPFAAAVALARPAGMDGAAGLTDELNAGLGQGSDTSLF
jgi:hypothetical protein